MKRIIQIKDVDFSYFDSSELLFNKLNLTVNEGEFLAIAGNNGSGKTTLAALIKGMLKPYSGEVFFLDEDVTEKGINSNIGYVFSNAENQIVSPVVEDDVAFGPENSGVYSDAIERAVVSSLHRVGAPHLQKELTHLLSGGEQQKVNVAGILALECKCIIFDEASSMLDPVSRKGLLKILRELNEEYGITIIQITHNLFELMNSDRVVYLKKGRISFDGKWEQLFEDENVRNAFTDTQRGVLAFIRQLNDLSVKCDDFYGDNADMAERIPRMSKESLK